MRKYIPSNNIKKHWHLIMNPLHFAILVICFLTHRAVITLDFC